MISQDSDCELNSSHPNVGDRRDGGVLGRGVSQYSLQFVHLSGHRGNSFQQQALPVRMGLEVAGAWSAGSLILGSAGAGLGSVAQCAVRRSRETKQRRRESYVDPRHYERSSYQAAGGYATQAQLGYQATEQGHRPHDIVTQSAAADAWTVKPA
jgi:hypothetical protein